MSFWFLRRILVAGLCLSCYSSAQAVAQPCCGPITPDGQRLAALLDHSGLNHLWQPHIHVNWQTGAADPAHPGWSPHATYCSSYAASMAERVGIYVLRPPAHGQKDLANAQFNWLIGPGKQRGWAEVDAKKAQTLANQGDFVLAVFQNPNPHRSGHVAVIRPSEKSLALLEDNGPEEAQAGLHNHVHTTISHGFADHAGAWLPNDKGAIRFFAHAVVWADIKGT